MNTGDIQKLAEELASLDRSKDAERISVIETAISLYELEKLKNLNGKAYFPLLKKHNGVIPFDDFYDIFINVLMSLLRGYKPEKGTFITALTFLLNNRVNDCITDLIDRTNNETSLNERLDTLGDAGDLTENTDFTEEAGEEQHTVIRVFVRLAPIVSEQKKLDKHRVKKMCFERFYTFDVVKTVKNEKDAAEESVKAKVNNTIFPIIKPEMVLLEYLMHGTFSHMRDVAGNEMKDVKLLNKRIEVIQKCYHVSKPTVCERNAKYYDIFIQAVYE